MAVKTIVDVKIESMRNEIRFSAHKLGHRLSAFGAKQTSVKDFGPNRHYTSTATCLNCGEKFTASIGLSGGGSYVIPATACPKKA
jgi:hypothetical protein